MKHRLSAILLMVLLAACAAVSEEVIRLDSSSDAAATASWERMLESVSPSQKNQLLAAMVQINLAGVSSAYEVVENPDLQRFGIVGIKDKVSDLNADEIIELGKRVSTMEVQPPAK